jgi:hypothetical protein
LRNLIERALILAQEGPEIRTTHADGYYPRAVDRAAYRVIREVVMFATRKSQEPVNAEANRFLFELEQEFDLMRLRARRASLEQEETRLAEEQESLRNDLRPPVTSTVGPSESPADNGWMRGWWHAVATRVAVWRLELRRVGLAEEVRRLVLLEGDIEFALRLKRRRSRS